MSGPLPRCLSEKRHAADVQEPEQTQEVERSRLPRPHENTGRPQGPRSPPAQGAPFPHGERRDQPQAPPVGLPNAERPTLARRASFAIPEVGAPAARSRYPHRDEERREAKLRLAGSVSSTLPQQSAARQHHCSPVQPLQRRAQPIEAPAPRVRPQLLASVGGAFGVCAGDGNSGSPRRIRAEVRRPVRVRAAVRGGTAMKGILLVAIRAYQAGISPLLPSACRFTPSCSEYARVSIERFGAARGSWLAMRRLARCHPLGGHGPDPVPEADRGGAWTGDHIPDGS